MFTPTPFRFCTSSQYEVAPADAFHVNVGERVAVSPLPEGETIVGTAGAVFVGVGVGVGVGVAEATVNWALALHALVPLPLPAFTNQPQLPLASPAFGVIVHRPVPAPQPAADGDTAMLTPTPFRFCTSSW